MNEKIIDKINKKKQLLSFEVFPPKKTQDENLENIFKTIKALKNFDPDFISVTYGVGGRNKPRAVKIAEFINELNITPLSHLTCYGYSKNEIKKILDELYSKGICNILALRGDKPEDLQNSDNYIYELPFAKDLIELIKKENRFCIGAAIYPEGHIECENLEKNILFVKQKIDAGANFFITQLFFDNNKFYRFMDLIHISKIENPIIPGIMPVLRASQIKRIAELSNTSIPLSLQNILDKYKDNPDDMEKAGIDYAVRQISDLLKNCVNGIHLYTMNKTKQIIEIVNNAGLKKS